MVASYTVEGDSFKPDKPRLWSDQAILQLTGQRSFNLHPDGERVAVAVPSNEASSTRSPSSLTSSTNSAALRPIKEIEVV
jgi:hypothetical protein